MEKPLTITSHRVTLPPGTEALIRDRAAGLERFYDALIGCSVVVRGLQQHHQTGGPFEVDVELRVPGGEPLLTNRQKAEDVRAAVHAAFDAARRQLQDFARVQRGAVKTHEPRPAGRVARLFEDEGFGFLETPDGREVYFHRNSVLGPGFERLTLGDHVRFTEEQGDQGPQASTVEILE